MGSGTLNERQQHGRRHIVQRPAGPPDLAVRQGCGVGRGGAGRADIDHLRSDLRERCMEMLGRLDDDEALALEVAAQLGEDVGAQRLVAGRHQHDLDAIGLDQRAVAHVGGCAGQAGHHHVVSERFHGALQVQRLA